MVISFESIPACDGRTDGRARCVCLCSTAERDKNYGETRIKRMIIVTGPGNNRRDEVGYLASPAVRFIVLLELCL